MSAVLLLSASANASHPNCSRYAFPSTSTGAGAVSCLCSALCPILPIVCLCCAVFACARSFVQMLFAFCGHLRFFKTSDLFFAVSHQSCVSAPKPTSGAQHHLFLLRLVPPAMKPNKLIKQLSGTPLLLFQAPVRRSQPTKQNKTKAFCLSLLVAVLVCIVPGCALPCCACAMTSRSSEFSVFAVVARRWLFVWCGWND